MAARARLGDGSRPAHRPGESLAERDDYREVLLGRRLRAALDRLNPDAPRAALDEAQRILTRTPTTTLLPANCEFHRRLTESVEVELPAPGGGVRGHLVRVVDFERPERNDWLAVNQFTVARTPPPHRRFDVVLFVNGLPLAVVELKRPDDPEATIWTAFEQLRTYQAELPTFFARNELLVVSDGFDARLGCIGGAREWFHRWRTRVHESAHLRRPVRADRPAASRLAPRGRRARRFRDPSDEFQLVIVRDMWLTGFDAPSLHTMYVDKPMRGHSLMQAIARVNRVFRDKSGGLVVDYIGIADDLRKALARYTESGGRGRPTVDQRDAVTAMLERLEVCRDLLWGFDYSAWTMGTAAERLRLIPQAQDHLLGQPDGAERFTNAVLELSRAFALAVPQPEAEAVQEEIRFFQMVKAGLTQTATVRLRSEEELDHAVRQIVAGAIAPKGVMDVFEAAGLPKPDISILSPDFLAEVRDLPQRHLAVELLRTLLDRELKRRLRRNVVQSRAFSEMLAEAIHRYEARAIETAQVIEELIELAKQMREAEQRGEQLGLSDEELAFYDALETNDSAVKVLGDAALRTIARELTETVRRNATIDWTLKESVQANLRVIVKRILRRHHYPPDRQERAVRTVLDQAKQLGLEFSESAPAVERAAVQAPFRVLPPDEARPYENSIPLCSLQAAAGAFGVGREVGAEAWVAPSGRTRPRPGLFTTSPTRTPAAPTR